MLSSSKKIKQRFSVFDWENNVEMNAIHAMESFFGWHLRLHCILNTEGFQTFLQCSCGKTAGQYFVKYFLVFEKVCLRPSIADL